MKFFTTSQISENIHKTPEGYLVCVGVSIGRTGEMTYGKGETPLETGPDGKVIVSRDQKELFRDETIASFEGKPVTILHPDEFVDPENWAELTKGILQNVRRGEGEQSEDLVSDILITHSAAIELVENGLREVSCGYESDFIETGVGRGIQTNIIGNHLALVEKGRAGSSYMINDHNGKGSKMKFSDRMKALLTKFQDEATKIAEEETKAGKVGDDGVVPAATQSVSGFTMADMKGYLDSKFEALMGKKSDDASSEPTQNEPAKVEAKDEEAEKKAKEEKQAARDAYIDAMMEKEKKESEDAEEGEESEDADEEESEESEDAVCDEASRVEILAPGMKAEGKNIKYKALLAAYQSADGKKVIEQFTGGKALDAKNVKFIDAVFIGASEVLKTQRNDELAGTRNRPSKTKDSESGGSKTPTPEELNKKNEEYWKNRK